MKTITLLSAMALAMGLSSCMVYELSVHELKERFAGIDSGDMKQVEVRGPFGERYAYLAHPSPTIALTDKKGRRVTITIKPSHELRVTYGGGKRVVFYLDKVVVAQGYLAGDRSRFSNVFSKRIPIAQIERLEVQDGKKRFSYVGARQGHAE